MVVFTLSLFLNTAHAVPQQLNQQGRLIDSNGAAVNGQHNLSFRLFESPSSTVPLWEESLTLTFTQGYYNATLGQNIASNPLEDSILAIEPLYIELEIDAAGPMTPRQMLSSTPYARLSAVAHSLDGGPVNAAEVAINGLTVIDASGTWVGPSSTTAWADILNIPADIADGDDDTLAGLSCTTGELLSWTGLGWGCASDNSLTEAEVEAFVTNNPIDLATGTTIGGLPILTNGDGDTLADLSCQNGDVAKYDAILGWVCDIDLSGGTALSEQEVEDFITNGALDLANGTTIGGNDPVFLVNGNLGLGTANPQYLLDVVGTANFNSQLLQTVDDNSYDIVRRLVQPGGNRVYEGWKDSLDAYGISVSAPGSTYDFVVKNNGNVGIGTTSPNALLEVQDTVDQPIVRIDGGSTGEPKLQFYGQGKQLAIRHDDVGASYGLVFENESNGLDMMAVHPMGKLSIGHTNPTEALDVTGNIVASGQICDSNGCIGSAGGSSGSCPSGMVLAGPVCVENTQRSSTRFDYAAHNCAAEEYRLCSMSDVMIGCTNGHISSSTTPEWIADITAIDMAATLASCFPTQDRLWSQHNAYRCCTDPS